jgi:hypothetical protein
MRIIVGLLALMFLGVPGGVVKLTPASAASLPNRPAG